jgi:hypothetical protein
VNARLSFFRIGNTLLLIWFVALISLLVLFVINAGISQADLPSFGALLGSLVIIALNHVLNLWMLQRYYPDREMSVRFRRGHGIITVLYAVSLVFLLVLLYYGLRDIYRYPHASLLVRFLLWGTLAGGLIGCVMVFVQHRLRGHIRRAYAGSLRDMIDNIGQTG